MRLSGKRTRKRQIQKYRGGKQILNMDGGPLQGCSTNPMTGYFRDGQCSTGPTDTGTHVVCAIMTDKFLKFSKRMGNDLITPQLPSFPGLKAGDRWCLCAYRWRQAQKAGAAPPIIAEATNQAVFPIVNRNILSKYRTRKSRS